MKSENDARVGIFVKSGVRLAPGAPESSNGCKPGPRTPCEIRKDSFRGRVKVWFRGYFYCESTVLNSKEQSLHEE